MSTPSFRTLHALRIKGFAKVETVAEIADLPLDETQTHLDELLRGELAMFREARALWQLTPAGKEHHAGELAVDVRTAAFGSALAPHYVRFMGLNEQFKGLCGAWQLRDGAPNDHSDPRYDRAVIERLVALDGEAQPVVAGLGTVLARLSPYGPRLAQTCQRLVGGETNMFTGVMCGSYHDVWMELHEDLILTQGISRAEEGSF